MENKIKVYHTFINKKGQLKKVHFLMDKQTYQVLQQVSKEERDKYMLEEYRWFCKEQKHKRRKQSINTFSDEDVELTTLASTDIVKTISYEEEKVAEIFRLLNDDEKQLIIWIYYEKLSQEEVAKIYNCSQQKVSYLHNKIIKKIRDKHKY